MTKTLKELSKTSIAPATAPSVAANTPRDLEQLAYVLWQERGCPEGSPEQDWFAAERLLQQDAPVPAPAPKHFVAGRSESES